MVKVREVWRVLGPVKGVDTSYSFGKVDTLEL